MSTSLPVIQTDTSTYERPRKRGSVVAPPKERPAASDRIAAAIAAPPASAARCARRRLGLFAAGGGRRTLHRRADCGRGLLASRPTLPSGAQRAFAARAGDLLRLAAERGRPVLARGRQFHAAEHRLTGRPVVQARHRDTNLPACHTADVNDPVGLVPLGDEYMAASPESHRCRGCHQLGHDEDALNPHGLSKERLAEIHRKITEQPHSSANTPLLLEVARYWPGQPQNGGELACALLP